jgi:hypothetical protein
MHFCALFETPAKVGLRIVMAVQVQTVAHSNVNQQGGTFFFYAEIKFNRLLIVESNSIGLYEIEPRI